MARARLNRLSKYQYKKAMGIRGRGWVSGVSAFDHSYPPFRRDEDEFRGPATHMLTSGRRVRVQSDGNGSVRFV
jgi:hypothetical protein